MKTWVKLWEEGTVSAINQQLPATRGQLFKISLFCIGLALTLSRHGSWLGQYCWPSVSPEELNKGRGSKQLFTDHIHRAFYHPTWWLAMSYRPTYGITWHEDTFGDFEDGLDFVKIWNNNWRMYTSRVCVGISMGNWMKIVTSSCAIRPPNDLSLTLAIKARRIHKRKSTQINGKRKHDVFSRPHFKISFRDRNPFVFRILWQVPTSCWFYTVSENRHFSLQIPGNLSYDTFISSCYSRYNYPSSVGRNEVSR